MARPTTKTKAKAVNLWLSESVAKEAAKVAYQFHGEASLSALVEKLLTREVARRLAVKNA